MTRTVTITLTPGTRDQLIAIAYALYVMKAVKFGPQGVPFPPSNAFIALPTGAGLGGGAPLIWRVVTQLFDNMTVAWAPDLKAYISTDPIVDQQTVTAQASAAVALGQTVDVSATGGLTVVNGGGTGAVVMDNQGTTEWTSGMMQGPSGPTAPYCAFPLPGQDTGVMTPLDQVLLMFTLNTLKAGAVIQTAYSAGLLVDAGAADRSVTYDINAGWSAGGAAWATAVPALSNLDPLLIQS